jgi:catechol 2,3-dioxygenase-like lactoylglutathione lyase family enzyme
MSTSTKPADRAGEPVVRCTGIDHVVLYVKDPRESSRFYIDVLGLTAKRVSGGYAFLYCGNQLLGLFAGDDDDNGAGREVSHLAFNVDRGTVAAVKAGLKARGIEVSGRSGDPDCIYFSDPDGHRLQLVISDE